MAKKRPKAKQTKKLTLEEKLKTFDGDVLLQSDDRESLSRTGLLDRTMKRRARYWCFKIRGVIVEGKKENPYIPKGFKEFIESLPGFAGWKHFAVSWDLVYHGDNQYLAVLRLQSVWDDWDAVMRKVAIPIDLPPEQIHERIQALTDEYARKEAKKK